MGSHLLSSPSLAESRVCRALSILFRATCSPALPPQGRDGGPVGPAHPPRTYFRPLRPPSATNPAPPAGAAPFPRKCAKTQKSPFRPTHRATPPPAPRAEMVAPTPIPAPARVPRTVPADGRPPSRPSAAGAPNPPRRMAPKGAPRAAFERTARRHCRDGGRKSHRGAATDPSGTGVASSATIPAAPATRAAPSAHPARERLKTAVLRRVRARGAPAAPRWWPGIARRDRPGSDGDGRGQ